MLRETQSQIAWCVASLRRSWAGRGHVQRRITEIRTGVPYVPRERHPRLANERALAHLFPDEAT
jgi:hypothetical protein